MLILTNNNKKQEEILVVEREREKEKRVKWKWKENWWRKFHDAPFIFSIKVSLNIYSLYKHFFHKQIIEIYIYFHVFHLSSIINKLGIIIAVF